MQKHRKKVLMAGISLGLAAALALGGSLAYFTDREAVTAEGTAGSLDITVENKTDLTAENAGGQNLLNPGDRKPVGWVVSEKGNKSADIRTTITLTSDIPMTTTEKPAEFEIYNADDVEEKKDEKNNSLGFAPKAGAEPLTEREISTDGKTITYKPAEYSLNGDTMSGVDAEEDIKDAGNSKESKYVLLFKQGATNAFQKANVTLNVLLEAKQHRNTDGKWGDIAKETYSINGKDTLVVPDNSNEPLERRYYSFKMGKSVGRTRFTLTNSNAKDNNTITIDHWADEGDSERCDFWGTLTPGTYIGSYDIVDDFNQPTGKTANVSVEIKNGVTNYDITDQTTLPDTLDVAGKTVNIRNLTFTLKENPEGIVRVGKAQTYFDLVSPDRDPQVLTRTFRVIANEAGSPMEVGILANDEFPYQYNGSDQWQQVDLSDGDKTVTFNGTFTKLPTATLTAASGLTDKMYYYGYYDTNGSWQNTGNIWFQDGTATLMGQYGTYKLVDTTNKKMYVFTFDADHTTIDLNSITPIDTTLTLKNTDSITSGTDVSFAIHGSDNRRISTFQLAELMSDDDRIVALTTLKIANVYDESAKKLKDGYTGEITYKPSDGEVTTKTVDLANRTIDFAQ